MLSYISYTGSNFYMEHTNRLLDQVVLSISLLLEYQYTKSFLETTPISLFPIIGLKKPLHILDMLERLLTVKILSLVCSVFII